MTPLVFIRHSGSQLRKFLGLDHKDVSFDNNYTFVEVKGKVIFRNDPEDEDSLMVLRAAEPLKLAKRAFVVTNPDLAKYTPFNSQALLEPGDIPTVYIHDYTGTFEEMNLEWLFRLYFIR
jgi:hypothetical protein